MRRFALRDGLSLVTTEPRPGAVPEGFPTDELQKGLLLLDGGHELGGEGVGFGVPVLKRGPRAVFSGSARTISVEPDPPSLTLAYRIDRVERISGSRRSPRALTALDLARESLAFVHRHVPPLRRPLAAASQAGRRLLRVETRFEATRALAEVTVRYEVVATPGEDEGDLRVTVSFGDLPPAVTEVVVMNELGAASFDLYEEAGRTTRGDGIGAWDRVRARAGRFRSSATGAWFELQSTPDPAVPGVRLFRGREVATGRLAWAGFGYSLRPGPPGFTYTVRFGRGAPERAAAASAESGGAP
jgi:hypothetical protein